MGRKKKVLTEAEIAERKQRWWGPERNARRRERYHQDELYRERAIAQVRNAYRRARYSEGLTVRNDDCRENVKILSQLGQVRTVRIDEDHTARMLTFTVDELAQVLGRNTQVVYRWLSTKMFPPPLYLARNLRNRWQAVYTDGEMRGIIMVFGRHQETSQYYRTFHTDTRDRLFEVVETARRVNVRRYGGAAA